RWAVPLTFTVKNCRASTAERGTTCAFPALWITTEGDLSNTGTDTDKSQTISFEGDLPSVATWRASSRSPASRILPRKPIAPVRRSGLVSVVNIFQYLKHFGRKDILIEIFFCQVFAAAAHLPYCIAVV